MGERKYKRIKVNNKQTILIHFSDRPRPVDRQKDVCGQKNVKPKGINFKLLLNKKPHYYNDLFFYNLTAEKPVLAKRIVAEHVVRGRG